MQSQNTFNPDIADIMTASPKFKHKEKSFEEKLSVFCSVIQFNVSL